MHVRGSCWTSAAGIRQPERSLTPINFQEFSLNHVGRAICGAPAPFSHPTETFLTARSRHLVPHKHVAEDE